MSGDTGMAEQRAWPRLRVADWTGTRDTLHMWAQIVGKIRLAHAPLLNHWWQVTLYVSPRGLTTSAIAHEDGAFDLEFDFIEHVLRIRTSDGPLRLVKPGPITVADFYAQSWTPWTTSGSPQFQPRPEVDPSIPFAGDREHASHDAESAHVLAAAPPGEPGHGRVRSAASAGQPGALLLGRAGPGHALRTARPTRRRAYCGDWVMVEGYSPGCPAAAGRAGARRAPSTPTPTTTPGFAAHPVSGRLCSHENGGFLL